MAKLLLLSFAVCSQIAVASFPAKVAGEIAAGVVEGFIGTKDVQDCIQKTVTEVGELEEAVQDLRNKTAPSVLKGLKLLVQAFQSLPADLRACKAVEADVKELINAFKQMSSPQAFAYHVGKDIVVNHADIFHEIETAISDYDAQKWLDFGIQVGTALHKLIIGAAQKFQEFEQHFGKVYSPEERQRRMDIFTHNIKQMRNLRRVEQGSAVYSHLTPFADLTSEEFTQRNGFRPDLMHKDSALELAAPLNTTDLPDDFDWVEKGAVNPVKNQAQCGSCWAFATVANIEGAGFVENKKLLSLSEQELVDCDKKTGDVGCQGGLPSNAYEDMIKNKIGLELESAYPYVATDGQCKAQQSSEKAFIASYVKIGTDEDQIAAALMKYGPLAIGINAGPMQWYGGGVAHPWSILCNPTKLDHGVAIVGFGVDSGKKYWKIRNSWGATWGEKGYYRIIRGTGACGLNTMVTSATGITLNSADVIV
jgi:cathepsin F